MLAVAHAPENGGNHVVAEDGDHAAEVCKRIVVGVFHGRLGDVHQLEGPVAEAEGEHRAAGGQDEAEGEQGADGVFQLVPVPGADVLGDDDLPGVGEAHADKEEEHGQLAAVGGGGQAGGAHILADDDHVRHIVDLLQQVGEDEGQSEGEQLLHGAAGGKILDDGFLLQNGRPPALIFYHYNRGIASLQDSVI